MPAETQGGTPYERDEILSRMADPRMFKPWIEAHNRAPSWTGRLVYCEGGNFGFTDAGHFVTRDQIAAGYRGHYTCKACAERLYGDKERAAREALANGER